MQLIGAVYHVFVFLCLGLAMYSLILAVYRCITQRKQLSTNKKTGAFLEFKCSIILSACLLILDIVPVAWTLVGPRTRCAKNASCIWEQICWVAFIAIQYVPIGLILPISIKLALINRSGISNTRYIHLVLEKYLMIPLLSFPLLLLLIWLTIAVYIPTPADDNSSSFLLPREFCLNWAGMWYFCDRGLAAIGVSILSLGIVLCLLGIILLGYIKHHENSHVAMMKMPYLLLILLLASSILYATVLLPDIATSMYRESDEIDPTFLKQIMPDESELCTPVALALYHLLVTCICQFAPQLAAPEQEQESKSRRDLLSQIQVIGPTAVPEPPVASFQSINAAPLKETFQHHSVVSSHYSIPCNANHFALRGPRLATETHIQPPSVYRPPAQLQTAPRRFTKTFSQFFTDRFEALDPSPYCRTTQPLRVSRTGQSQYRM
ncbi:hypothetical protein CANCADRAFT_4421 [Tortispora caseinolytica NRRL Y-17796]|uniref:Uncharacterized protein n=1 Tax=Tortispora caseinolytica NRRL Y-17796 TaxID=767744 RepID=A0A1E4TDF6_9ASCO|nr:hypothetical protein CANCADRAFT_4421 [Tortispora caseinolytica NRRL Y-17796]